MLSKYDHAGTESFPTDFKEYVSHFNVFTLQKKTKVS